MVLCADMLRLTAAVILSLFLLSGTEGMKTRPHEYRRECVVWDHISSMLEKKPNMEVYCQKNTQCTGFDCVGNYTFRGLATLYQKFVQEMCFGVTIHPCHQPVDMQLYVEWPDKNTTFRHTSITSERVPVQGAMYDITTGKADAFILIDMAHINVGGQPYLKIGMKLKVRLTMLGHEIWPESLAVQLIPDTEIPVPRCDKSVITPPHKAGTCNISSRVPSVVPVDVIPEGHGKPCTSNSMHACLSGEMCFTHDNSGNGYCVCLNGYTRDHDSGDCKLVSSTAVPVIKPGADNQPTGSGSKELIIVLCSCVAGVAIIGIAVLLVVLRLRKHRARYAQHEQLLNNEDDPLEVLT